MLFRKLFQILVVGGAVLGAGANSGCSRPAHAQQGGDKKGDGGTQGTAQGGTDAGTPDAGGGGVQGW